MEAKQPGNTANDPPLLFLVGGQEFRAHDPRHIRLVDLQTIADHCLNALDHVPSRHSGHGRINRYLANVTVSIERLRGFEIEFADARERYLAQLDQLRAKAVEVLDERAGSLNGEQAPGVLTLTAAPGRLAEIRSVIEKFDPKTIAQFEQVTGYLNKAVPEYAEQIHWAIDQVRL